MGTTLSHNVLYIDPKEYSRRVNIIRKMIESFPFRVGELATTVYESEALKLVRITGIIDTWDKYKGSEKDENKVEWPADDEPRLINAFSFAEKKLYVCKPKIFVKLTKEQMEQATALLKEMTA